MDRLLIIDGHAYAYRAFHAIRELRGPDGRATNAIYGFIKMLGKMRGIVAPTHLIVVWDGGLSEKRRVALPEYKAHRPEMPVDLEAQLDGIVNYLKASGTATYSCPGVEADDYIACLTWRAVKAGAEVVIASSDKDFMQLVSERVKLLNPNDKSETLWTDEQVRSKTGVAPKQIVDWLSLTGDSVDNIRGVPGVGPKTATALIGRFGSIDELYARSDEVKSPRLAAVLKESESIVRRNQELVRLHDDLACEFCMDDMIGKTADNKTLEKLYRGWGFKGLLAALNAPQENQAALL